ncbi:Adenylosuccinate lyase [Mycena kentingensis (nom. inval.)]|nr:Adenylosuccinate lyase [Mycena kentingensis (nom. inval.)]
MVRRVKQEYDQINLSSLTKASVVVLQRYLEHGESLPALSLKTSYRNIYRHTRRFQAVRRVMSGVAARVRAFERKSKDIVSALPASWNTLNESITTLHDDCARMQQFCKDFERDCEADLEQLEKEVALVKTVTNAKERKDLLVELTRALPVVRQMNDSFKQHRAELATIQETFKAFENANPRPAELDKVVALIGTGAAQQFACLV